MPHPKDLPAPDVKLSRDPGYFGWTDRYGGREPFFDNTKKESAPKPPFFAVSF